MKQCPRQVCRNLVVDAELKLRTADPTVWGLDSSQEGQEQERDMCRRWGRHFGLEDHNCFDAACSGNYNRWKDYTPEGLRNMNY